MIQISQKQLLMLAPKAEKWGKTLPKLVESINQAMNAFEIGATPRRARYFLAQCAHETAGFTAFEESLYYTDAKRVATMFRYGFDTNHNGVTDPEEVRIAATYLRNSEKLANRVYANRFGNGDEQSGDGWRYRGSGMIMTTFKSNYLAASRRLYKDERLVASPELLRDTTTFLVPALSAGAFWADNKLNELADQDSFTKVSAVIQGNTSTVNERLVYLRKANAIPLV